MRALPTITFAATMAALSIAAPNPYYGEVSGRPVYKGELIDQQCTSDPKKAQKLKTALSNCQKFAAAAAELVEDTSNQKANQKLKERFGCEPDAAMRKRIATQFRNIAATCGGKSKIVYGCNKVGSCANNAASAFASLGRMNRPGYVNCCDVFFDDVRLPDLTCGAENAAAVLVHETAHIYGERDAPDEAGKYQRLAMQLRPDCIDKPYPGQYDMFANTSAYTNSKEIENYYGNTPGGGSSPPETGGTTGYPPENGGSPPEYGDNNQPPTSGSPPNQPPTSGSPPSYEPPTSGSPPNQPPTSGSPPYEPPTSGSPPDQPPTSGSPPNEPPTSGSPPDQRPTSGSPPDQPPTSGSPSENPYGPPQSPPDSPQPPQSPPQSPPNTPPQSPPNMPPQSPPGDNPYGGPQSPPDGNNPYGPPLQGNPYGNKPFGGGPQGAVGGASSSEGSGCSDGPGHY